MIYFFLGISLVLNLLCFVIFIFFYKAFKNRFDSSIVDFKSFDDFFNH